MAGQVLVSIDGSQWSAFLAVTVSELSTGLSGVSNLPAGQGVLFDLGYDQRDIQIDMTDMLFSLDIAFINSEHGVVGVLRGVKPSESAAFDAGIGYGARYFLEVNAGELGNVGVGDNVSISGRTQPAFWAGLVTAVMAISQMAIVGATAYRVVKEEITKGKQPSHRDGLGRAVSSPGLSAGRARQIVSETISSLSRENGVPEPRVTFKPMEYAEAKFIHPQTINVEEVFAQIVNVAQTPEWDKFLRVVVAHEFKHYLQYRELGRPLASLPQDEYQGYEDDAWEFSFIYASLPVSLEAYEEFQKMRALASEVMVLHSVNGLPLEEAVRVATESFLALQGNPASLAELPSGRDGLGNPKPLHAKVTTRCPVCKKLIEVPEYNKVTRTEALRKHIEEEHPLRHHSIHGPERDKLVRIYGSWAVGRAESVCPEGDVQCVEHEAAEFLAKFKAGRWP